MVSTVLAMTVDYGTNTFTGPVTVHSHPGDTEVFFTVWRVGADDQLRFHGLHSKAHEGDFPGRGSTYLPANTKHLTFTAGEHRLVIYLEEDKHGVWPIWQLCNNLSPYDCRGEKAVLQTRAVNVGEPPAGSSIHPNSRPGRPLINVLADVNGEDDSPFMHDLEVRVWSDEKVWSDSHFLGDAATSIGQHLAGPASLQDFEYLEQKDHRRRTYLD